MEIIGSKRNSRGNHDCDHLVGYYDFGKGLSPFYLSQMSANDGIECIFRYCPQCSMELLTGYLNNKEEEEQQEDENFSL